MLTLVKDPNTKTLKLPVIDNFLGSEGLKLIVSFLSNKKKQSVLNLQNRESYLLLEALQENKARNKASSEINMLCGLQAPLETKKRPLLQAINMSKGKRGVARGNILCIYNITCVMVILLIKYCGIITCVLVIFNIYIYFPKVF